MCVDVLARGKDQEEEEKGKEGEKGVETEMERQK